MEPTAIHVAITQAQQRPLPDKEAVWSIAGVSRVFGASVGEAVYTGILDAGLPGLAARFASVGLDARNDQWLEMADIIATATPDLAPHADRLKYLGFDRRSLWAQHSIKPAPTLDDVTSAVDSIKASRDRNDALQSILDRANAAITAAQEAVDAEQPADAVILAADQSWKGE